MLEHMSILYTIYKNWSDNFYTYRLMLMSTFYSKSICNIIFFIVYYNKVVKKMSCSNSGSNISICSSCLGSIDQLFSNHKRIINYIF